MPDDALILAAPVTEKDHAQGPADAAVTLVEYGDYECPSCLNSVPIIRALQDRFGPRLRLVFRHFPLTSVHPHASEAANAAEAASDQGKFWEMHELLFKHQKDFGNLDLTHLALKLGLEVYRFDAARGDATHAKRVRNDVASGTASGVTGTPTFFINERRYTGPITVDALSLAIEEAGA
jgi:formate-nitrite transporter family protein